MINYRFFLLFLLFGISINGIAQLSSLEVSGSSAVINNPNYKLNGTRDILLRFNQKIGWYFSGNIAVAYNVTHINTLPKVQNDYAELKNVYTAYQVGGNFNLLSAIRTFRKGGKSAIGDKEISLAHFKVYLCGGAEFLQLKKTDDDLSYKRVTNIYGGLGIEVYRLGKYARKKYGAVVPFFETRYFYNTNGAYYASTTGFVRFNKMAISAGIKYTFGLPEAK